jgi:tetratricopeptide (TPR) repeat protein
LAYVHLYRGEADEAIRAAQKGVDLGSELAASHTVLGEAYFWKGSYDRAAAEYNRAIGLNSVKTAAEPKGAFALNEAKYDSHKRLAEVYYIQKNYELAKTEFDEALKLAKSWNYTGWIAEANSQLGFVALKERKLKVAAERFKEALGLYQYDANLSFGLGVLFAALSKPEDAKAEWNKALKLRTGSDPLEGMVAAVTKVALGTPGAVEEMSSIIKQRPPTGMIQVALDDADSLVMFGIALPASEEVRKMLAEAVEDGLKQPAQQE